MFGKCRDHKEFLNQVELSEMREPIKLVCQKCNTKQKMVMDVTDYNKFLEQKKATNNLLIRDQLSCYRDIKNSINAQSLSTFIEEQLQSVELQETLIKTQEGVNELEHQKYDPETWDSIKLLEKKVIQEKTLVREQLMGFIKIKIFNRKLETKQLEGYVKMLENYYDDDQY